MIKDRTQLNGALYKMLNTEQLVVYLIFTLILIIALFNIVGSIVMMILEKKENLKTLFNIGATKRMIQKVFFLHGLLITFFGGLAGLSLGIIVIFVQQYFELVLITPTLPYPVILSWINILISFATIFILGSIASLLASFSIKKLDFKV